MPRHLLTACVALLIAGLAAPAADAPAKKNLLKPANNVASWRLEQYEGGNGTIAVDGDAIVFDATDIDDTAWHFQANQIGLDLKEGQLYVVTFKAKSAAARVVQLSAMIDQEDWHGIGLIEALDLTPDWKEFKFEFKAEQTAPNKNRIGFVLGNEKGKVWVKDFSLAEK
jgi:hypothetical protein